MPTLSERLLNTAWRISECMKLEVIGGFGGEIADLEEAAHLLQSYEQPDVEAEKDFARRLREAADGWPCGIWMKATADRLDDYARALVELTDAQEKLKRVAGLPDKWLNPATGYLPYASGGLQVAAAELDAALVDAIRAAETAVEEADHREELELVAQRLATLVAGLRRVCAMGHTDCAEPIEELLRAHGFALSGIGGESVRTEDDGHAD